MAYNTNIINLDSNKTLEYYRKYVKINDAIDWLESLQIDRRTDLVHPLDLYKELDRPYVLFDIKKDIDGYYNEKIIDLIINFFTMITNYAGTDIICSYGAYIDDVVIKCNNSIHVCAIDILATRPEYIEWIKTMHKTYLEYEMKKKSILNNYLIDDLSSIIVSYVVKDCTDLFEYLNGIIEIHKITWFDKNCTGELSSRWKPPFKSFVK